jgi:methyltransferase
MFAWSRLHRQLYNHGSLIMWPLLILTFVTVQRLVELVIAKRNTAALLATGGKEIGAAHYPLIVAFHSLWILGLWIFAREQSINWTLIGVFAVLQTLRIWVLATLGKRWTTRIIIMPEKPLVVGGPFRFFKHPNYAVVACEIFVLPLAFGLVWFAVLGGAINLAILAYRIHVEERALSPQR